MRVIDRTLVIVALVVAAVAILRPTTSPSIADSMSRSFETLSKAPEASAQYRIKHDPRANPTKKQHTK